MYRPFKEDPDKFDTPRCSYCGKETNCMTPGVIRGITRYFCSAHHRKMYEFVAEGLPSGATGPKESNKNRNGPGE